jgi:hydrogenase maturation protease
MKSAATRRPNIPNAPGTLLIGIGNSGRRDDGLGWAFLDSVEQKGTFEGDILYRYQLQIEDAEIIRHYRHVVFVDACKEPLSDGCDMRPCLPERKFEFTTHNLSPAAVLYLCLDLYGTLPEVWQLMISGHAWGLGIGLSRKAQKGLAHALRVLDAHTRPIATHSPNSLF